MGFFDDAQEMLDKGVSMAKGAVSGVAVEQQGFVKGFVRLCRDGWDQGWHERNGGNATYRLAPENLSSCRSYFYDTPSSWVPLGLTAPGMRRAYFLVTRAGGSMRNVALDPDAALGIVELDADGGAWRIVWGFKNGGMPTSELASHVLIHEARAAATEGACRVLYHAHPANVVALSAVMPLEARTVTRALWKTMTESIIAFPEGLGVVPWMVPGGPDIARATADLMGAYAACLWAQHGLFCSGIDFDAAFGLMHTVEKAADVYVRARLLNGGNATLPHAIPDVGLRAIAETYKLAVNEAFLDV